MQVLQEHSVIRNKFSNKDKMKIKQILRELFNTPNIKNLQYKLEQEGYKKIASGDYGIAMQKGNIIQKITTDIDELRHCENLVKHNFNTIIPIYKVVIKESGLGIIEMANAEPLTDQEKVELENFNSNIQDFLEGTVELSKDIPNQIRVFIQSLKSDFIKAGLDPQEIDWSVDNVMKYKEKYVLVDV